MLRMRRRIAATTGGLLSGRYTLDKLLSNGTAVSADFATRQSAHLLLSIREPDATLRSMLSMKGQGRRPPPWNRSAELAGAAYILRIQERASWSETGVPYTLFPAEAVVRETTHLLTQISRDLNLDIIPDGRYAPGAWTRRPGFGDVSENIAAGRVVHDRAAHFVDRPPDMRHETWKAYQTSWTQLLAASSVVPCPDLFQQTPDELT